MSPPQGRSARLPDPGNLVKKIDRFIRTHNKNSHLFVWTATADSPETRPTLSANFRDRTLSHSQPAASLDSTLTGGRRLGLAAAVVSINQAMDLPQEIDDVSTI